MVHDPGLRHTFENGTQIVSAPTSDESGPAIDRADVELRLPADGAYASVLRTTTAALAARLDFTIDDIEDLRIAVAEAGALVLPEADPDADLTARFHLGPGTMTDRGLDRRRSTTRSPTSRASPGRCSTRLTSDAAWSPLDGRVPGQLHDELPAGRGSGRPARQVQSI